MRKLSRLLAGLAVASLLAVGLVAVDPSARPAEAATHGNRCFDEHYRLDNLYIFRHCYAVESNASNTQVRYRAHFYCYRNSSATPIRCNFRNHDASLEWKNQDPDNSCFNCTGNFGVGDFPGVLNETDHVYVGHWHDETVPSYSSYTRIAQARFLERDFLTDRHAGCTLWVNPDNNDVGLDRCLIA